MCEDRQWFPDYDIEKQFGDTTSFYLELGVYFAVALVLEGTSSISVFATTGNTPKEGELAENEYIVDTTFYAVDSVFEILASIARVYLTYVAIVNTNNRMNTACKDSTLYGYEIFLMVALSLGCASILFKMVWGFINSVNYLFNTTGIKQITLYKLDSIFNDPNLQEEEGSSLT